MPCASHFRFSLSSSAMTEQCKTLSISWCRDSKKVVFIYLFVIPHSASSVDSGHTKCFYSLTKRLILKSISTCFSMQRSWKSREIFIRNWAWKYPGISKESCATWRPTWTRNAMVCSIHTLSANWYETKVPGELQYRRFTIIIVHLQTGASMASAISSPSAHALFCYVTRPNYSAALLMRSNCAVVVANGFADGYPGACQACSLNCWPNAQAQLW